ncbi:MAG TPA: beta-ketoacyl-ACP synthase I [Gammaproteobacteria bacterium]|nr:beta-ketoacyl-ACP synthase I [Gammaproteobacteria bacterium]
MRRIVVTGFGIISSIGNNKEEVSASLRQGKSGIVHSDEYAELGFRSQVCGPVEIDIEALIDRKIRRFMGEGAAYCYIAMREAITHAGLEEIDISNPRTGLIMGTGGASTSNVVQSADILRSKGVRRIGPYMVTRTMSSTNAACLCTPYKIKGVSYTISSACSTSAHCISNAAEQIMLGKQDVMFAGGGEEVHWTMSSLFDAMGALSSHYNAAPQTASRPFDVTRDGFVISGGGGVMVLESLEHAQARGANILAELSGYGITSDGYDMVQPSGEGAERCMHQALATVDEPIDYINAHGTSTPIGDQRELEAVRGVFQEAVPPISSTKSLTGHALGAAGANEAIYSLLMMENDFIAASANITELDPKINDMPIVTRAITGLKLNTIMSNSFGFGGANSTLIFSRFKA